MAVIPLSGMFRINLVPKTQDTTLSDIKMSEPLERLPVPVIASPLDFAAALNSFSMVVPTPGTRLPSSKRRGALTSEGTAPAFVDSGS
jgi:hypothetical protein